MSSLFLMAFVPLFKIIVNKGNGVTMGGKKTSVYDYEYRDNTDR